MIKNIEYELIVFGANVPRNEITVCKDIVQKDSGAVDPVGTMKFSINSVVKMYVAKFIMEKCIITIAHTGEVISLRPLESE